MTFFCFYLALVASIHSVVWSTCPMSHDPCFCNVTAPKEYELTCRDLDSKMVEQALEKVATASDYIMNTFVLDNITLSEEKLKMPEKFCYQIINLNARSTKSTKVNFLSCTNGLPNLQTLTIVKNQDLKSIEETISANFPRLICLVIIESSIEEIPRKAFSKLYETLIELKIEDSKLTEFPLDALVDLKGLQSISLKGDAIPFVNNETVLDFKRALKHLQNIILDQLDCTCELWKSELRLWMLDKRQEELQCTFEGEERKVNVMNSTKRIFCTSNDTTSMCVCFINNFSVLLLLLVFFF